MAEPDGALVTKYVQRNNAIKNKGDVAGLNAEIKKYVEDNNISQAVRRASSVAASNVQSNSRGGDIKNKTKMAYGGMANGKKHMYLNKGALVTENLNPGLKALAKERPDVVKKILNK